jgi:hypothetical protein
VVSWVRKRASGAGMVATRRNYERTVTRGVEVGYSNERGWGCGSDAEGRRNKTSDRWRASCHGGGRDEEESDIVDAKGREMFSLD